MKVANIKNVFSFATKRPTYWVHIYMILNNEILCDNIMSINFMIIKHIPNQHLL